MTLVVETGAGLPTANSYVSVVAADAYHLARGNEAWAEADTAEKEAALVRAAFSIDSWLRGRWVGKKLTAAQALAWPRTGATDEDGFDIAGDVVPAVVANASAEVALIELSTRFLQQTVGADNAIASESVGPISVSYRADAPTVVVYPHIEAMLRGVAAVGGVQIGMSISLTDAEKAAQASTSFTTYPDYFNMLKA